MSPSFLSTGSSWGLLSEAKLTNIGLFRSALHSHPNFHEVCGCFSGSTATPGHPHTKLYRRLVDSSSIRADGGSTSRCRSCPYERVGVNKPFYTYNCEFADIVLAFSSNHNQAHLIQLIKIFRITRNFQAGVSWSWLELNLQSCGPPGKEFDTTGL